MLVQSAAAKFIPLLALGVVWPVECLAQAFPLKYERRISKPEVGKFLEIASKGDFNGDGVPDLLAGRGPEDGAQFRLSLLRGKGDGTFREATSEVIKGKLHTLSAPKAITADFNGDGRLDIAVYEYAFGIRGAPMVLMSRDDGTLGVSSALADAVESFHVRDGNPENGPDLVINGASAGDIDNDGDTDLWVESCGAAVSATPTFAVTSRSTTATKPLPSIQRTESTLSHSTTHSRSTGATSPISWSM